MNKKISPVVGLLVILAVIGIALGVMFHFADQIGPPTATSMGQAMAAQKGQQNTQNRPPSGKGMGAFGAPGSPAGSAGNKTTNATKQ